MPREGNEIRCLLILADPPLGVGNAHDRESEEAWNHFFLGDGAFLPWLLSSSTFLSSLIPFKLSETVE